MNRGTAEIYNITGQNLHEKIYSGTVAVRGTREKSGADGIKTCTKTIDVWPQSNCVKKTT